MVDFSSAKNMGIFWFGIVFCMNLCTISHACAPYFQTETWKAKQTAMNSSTYCKAPYKDPDMDKITFTGERYCKELFVGQAFCNFKCKNFESTQDITDCQNDRSLAKIDCSKFRLLGDGKTPESLFFTCTCTYNGVGQGACQTKEYQWSDAESLFDQYCSNTNNTAQASRAFDSITSQDGGRTIVSNQTTIYNNTLIYVMMPYGGKSRRKKIVLDAKSFNKSDELSPLLLEPIENLERFSASSDNPNEESTTYSTTTAETTTIVPEVTGETTTYVSTTSTRASSQSPNDFAV